MKQDTTRPKISVYILTKNSGKDLKMALDSVKSFASEIIIADGYSTDDTLKIAEKYGCKVFQKKFEGFDIERNYAISKCTNEWIFEIDSDEEIDKEMQENIIETLKNPKYEVYKIKRKDFFLKRPLCELTLIRLYKKGTLHYVGATHEQVTFDKKVSIGRLKGFCYHRADDTDHIFQSINKWDVETEREIMSPKRFGKKRMGRIKLWYYILIYPTLYILGLLFYKRFIFKGMNAIIWAICSGFYMFLIYAKYYEVYYLKVRGFDKNNIEFKWDSVKKTKNK